MVFRSKRYKDFIGTDTRIKCTISGDDVTQWVYIDNDPNHSDLLVMALSPALATELKEIGGRAFEMKHGVNQYMLVAKTCIEAHALKFFDLRWFHGNKQLPQLLITELYNLMGVPNESR